MIDSFYPPSYYGVTGAKFVPLVEALVRIVGARHVRMLSRGLARGARVLDVGCGRGVLLSSLADRGLRGSRIRDQRGGCRRSRSAGRSSVLATSSTRPAIRPTWFDEVIIWHVLEHCPRSAGDVPRNPPHSEAGRTPDRRRSQLQQPAGAVVGCGLVPSRFAAAPVSLSARRAAPAAGRYRALRRGSEHHFSLRQNPFGWVQSALNKFASAAAKRTLHAAEIAARGGAALPFVGSNRVSPGLLVRNADRVRSERGRSSGRSGASVCIVSERRRD